MKKPEQSEPRTQTPQEIAGLEAGRKLKHSRKATQARQRQRARRERMHDASPEGQQDRQDAAEQEEFLRQGPPGPKANPIIIRAWHRAAAMTPSERREAWAAQSERFRIAAGLPPGTQAGGILPADGSGDPNDPETYVSVVFFPVEG